MKVVFSKRARDDLIAIADYIAIENPKRAALFVRDLRRACSGLGNFPLGYEQVRLPKATNIRRRPYKSYSIYYRVAEIVVILHIRHNARDAEALFFSGGDA